MHPKISSTISEDHIGTGDYAVFFYGLLTSPIIIVDYRPEAYGQPQTILQTNLSFDLAMEFAHRVQEETGSPIRIVDGLTNEYYIHADDDTEHRDAIAWVLASNRRNGKRRAAYRARKAA